MLGTLAGQVRQASAQASQKLVHRISPTASDRSTVNDRARQLLLQDTMVKPGAAPSPEKIDDKRVFLALRGIFSGEKSKIRQMKSIRTLLVANFQNDQLKSLRKDYTIEVICVSAQSLLEKGFFESTSAIDVLFPGLTRNVPVDCASIASSANVKKRCNEPKGSRQGNNEGQSGLKVEKEVKKAVEGMCSAPMYLGKLEADSLKYLLPYRRWS